MSLPNLQAIIPAVEDKAAHGDGGGDVPGPSEINGPDKLNEAQENHNKNVDQLAVGEEVKVIDSINKIQESGEPAEVLDKVKELDNPSVVIENSWKLSQFLNCLACCGRNPTEVQEVEEIVVGVESQERMLAGPEISLDSHEERCPKLEADSDPLSAAAAGTSSTLADFKPAKLKKIKRKCAHLVLNDNELYFNARKWRKGSKNGGDLIKVLNQYPNCLPRTTTIVLSDGPESLKIVKHHDFSVGLSILKLEDCSLGITQLSEILLFCLNLSDVTLTMSDSEYDFHLDPNKPSVGTSDDQLSLYWYQQAVKNTLEDLKTKQSMTSSERSALSRVKLHFPLAKACTVALMIFNGVYGKSLQLDTLEISYSQRNMIRTLNLMDSQDASETLMQDAIALDCLETLANSRLTLRKLSLSCKDQFPLDWLRDVSENGENINVFIFLKVQVTRGLLRTLTHLKEDSLIFPQLEDLSLHLPLLRIIDRTDEFSQVYRNLMTDVKDFVLCNNMLKKLRVDGIRTDREMLPWIKCTFDGPAGCLTDLGVTYYPSELKLQLHEYFDQIGSLGIIVDKNASERDINAMINPNRRNRAQIFPSIGTLHIVNQLPTLQSYSIVALMNKFPKLSKLVIEEHDYSKASLRNGPGEPSSTQIHASQAKIGNKELNNIIKALNGTLCHLHLDCNLLDITDAGLTGSKSREPQTFTFIMSPKTHVFSFSHLSGLRYLYLRGLGDGVTEISAKLCFADYLEFKKLRELHLFAPNMSKVGRDLIKERFASQRDFILELE